MQINLLKQYNVQNNSKRSQNFKGAADLFTNSLRFLNNNEALGASFVDFAFMTTPRTVVDMGRGINAGLETGARESAGTFNHISIGLWGALASTVTAKMLGINKLFNIRADKVYANNESIDLFSSIYNSNTVQNSKNKIETFIGEIFGNAKGLNKSGFNAIDEATRKEVVKDFTEFFQNPANNSVYKLPKELKSKIKTLITASTGAEKTYALKQGSKEISSNLETLIDNVTSLGHVFRKQEGQISQELIKKLKSNKTIAAIAGLAVPAIIGFMVQPLNAYITKKRTGQSGFVGIQSDKQDNSNTFVYKKAAASVGAFSILALASISRKPAEILNKLQFNSLIPNISQFKFVYGTTIAGRLIAARDKNELRESLIKDSLGFANWLILGSFVSKLAAGFMFKKADLINFIKPKNWESMGAIRKGFYWITNATIKTCDEVLLGTLGKLPKDKIKLVQNGAGVPFKELLKQTETILDNGAKQALRGKLRAINIAQLMGYAYSALALGIGIPKLNIYLTKKLNQQPKKTIQKLENNPNYTKYIFTKIYSQVPQTAFHKKTA